jgi:Protein of unknown function (DUF2997)
MAGEIIIEVDDEGTVEVKTHGFKGKACMKASEFIEQALGKVVSTKKTGEYYAEEVKETVRIKSNGNS